MRGPELVLLRLVEFSGLEHTHFCLGLEVRHWVVWQSLVFGIRLGNKRLGPSRPTLSD